jgi:hypothetical protein
VIQSVGLEAVAEQLRDRVRTNLDLFVHEVADPGDPPRFVLGHVPAPHGPLVFADDGTAAVRSLYRVFVDRPDQWPEDRFLEAYRQHIRRVDALVAEAVTAAVARATRPSVFVVFSDHGYRRNGAIGSAILDPTAVDVREQYRNLFAWKSDVLLDFGAEPSLVNVFPILLRSAWRIDMPCQDSRMFFIDPRAGITEVRDPDDGSVGPGVLPDEPGCGAPS